MQLVEAMAPTIERVEKRDSGMAKQRPERVLDEWECGHVCPGRADRILEHDPLLREDGDPQAGAVVADPGWPADRPAHSVHVPCESATEVAASGKRPGRGGRKAVVAQTGQQHGRCVRRAPENQPRGRDHAEIVPRRPLQRDRSARILG